MQKVTPALSRPLFSIAGTRQIEQQAAAALPPHTLMQRAGLATARLALALAPHARRIWIACGPGNNGGDGFEAALQLHLRGKAVAVTWTGTAPGKSLPPDAQTSYSRLRTAGVPIADEPPDDFDFCIDALLGVGASGAEDRTARQTLAPMLARLYGGQAPCLAVDVPSGLDADTGSPGALAGLAGLSEVAMNSIAAHARIDWAKARFTLSLLTLKPGLFTAHGRDAAGEVWFDDLGISPSASTGSVAPVGWLLGADRAAARPRVDAAHASHKGSFGDVAVVGGESDGKHASHMMGAVLLAARGALHAGAGRVSAVLLGDEAHPGQLLALDPAQPEIMFRSLEAIDLARQTVVCGCGGGEAVRPILPRVLSTAASLVLDADALNAISRDTALQTLLRARARRGWRTVLTPHPLEAARLLGQQVADVQADRLAAAARLAAEFGCAAVLKGSGTVIASPGSIPAVNSTGNALLATAGTGDVLAGLVGARLAAGDTAFHAACSAVFAHGAVADRWAVAQPRALLTASALAVALSRGQKPERQKALEQEVHRAHVDVEDFAADHPDDPQENGQKSARK
jgi:ADP-dependent NAD(P)H-hydrate dehydratase / NAD(P)H-hydrate epimerase